jgi:hypothetical protein
MHLLLNREEVMIGLAKQIMAEHLKKIQPSWTDTAQYIDKVQLRQAKSGLIEIDFNTVNQLLRQDVQCYKDDVVREYKKKYRPLVRWLASKFDELDIDRQYLIDLYLKNSTTEFVRAVGKQLSNNPVWTISGDPVPDNHSVVLRNILNNESLLQYRMENQHPFWFIDSGYTNFLTGKKNLHRLVPNHIHHLPGKKTYYPADRLHLLPSMPAPWRQGGDTILVIENSEYHHQLFGTTLEKWKHRVLAELQLHTNLKIEFRPKNLDRKTRDNLYEHLKNSNYYCVITDASCSAIEAVWAGIPIITLNKHISQPVARTAISDINNLYRGPIGNWLCALSYSQFTKKEMFNGTALALIKKYHV